MDHNDLYIHDMNSMHQQLRRLDLNLLVVFDALMQERNVSRAADLCYLSQPAMSNALKRLREMLDDPILVRTTSGMQPSPRAVMLEDPIRSLLSQMGHQLTPPATFDPAITDRVFRIALTDYGENIILPLLCMSLSEKAPNASIETIRLSPQLPVTEMEKGEIDLVIGVQEYTCPPKQFVTRPWIRDHLVCIERKSKKNKKSITLKSFVKRRHVYPSPLGIKTNIVETWLESQGLSRNIAVSTHSYLVAAQMVAKTDYLLSLPNRIAEQLVKMFPLHLIQPPRGFPGFQLNLIWHSLYANDPGIKWLLNQLNEIEQAFKD